MMKNFYFVLPLFVSICTIAVVAESSNQEQCIKENISAGASRRDHRTRLMKYSLCLHHSGHTNEALVAYDELRKLYSDYAFPLINLAYIHLRDGRPWQTIQFLDQYFDEVGGWEGKSRILDEDSQIFGSPCHSKSLFRSDCVSALNLRGVALSNVHNHTRALDAYSLAIEIGQGTAAVADVYTNLGTLQYEMGQHSLAQESFLSSFRINYEQDDSTDPGALIQRATLVPSIPVSLEDSTRALKEFNDCLSVLEVLIDQGGVGLAGLGHLSRFSLGNQDQMKIVELLPPIAKSASILEALNHFHLHFYGFRDREALERLSLIMTKVTKEPLMTVHDDIEPSLSLINAHNTGTKGEKKLIVFVSCLIGGNEPHGQLVREVIKRLPSRLFETSAIGIGSIPPAKDFISVLTGEFYSAGNDREKVRSLLTLLRPDALVFIENLNCPIMHYLAFQRFAPIQVLLMGAPLTGGIPTIDYFLSGDRLEHPLRTQASGDLSHLEPYTEQVVLFDGQAISFPKEQSHPRQDSLLAAGEAAGISSYNVVDNTTLLEYSNKFTIESMIYDEFNVPVVEGNIYMCFQNLFKIQPIFDSVIASILHGDPNGHVVLQAARINHKTDIVKQRIKRYIVSSVCDGMTKHDDICNTAHELLYRIHFIPRVQSNQLAGLFKRATVILQPFPFGGSKTASDILGSGVPLVTFPQRYLKGRMASTFYSTLALHEIDPGVKSSICCVASSIGDYISKSLRLGMDSAYRNRVASAIDVRKERIFNDVETSFEWARFLSRTMGVTVRDDDLALEMKFVREEWQTPEFHQNLMSDQQSIWKRAKMEAFMQTR